MRFFSPGPSLIVKYIFFWLNFWALSLFFLDCLNFLMDYGASFLVNDTNTAVSVF